MASREEKRFQSSLRQRIGMKDTSPATAIGDAWRDMESALAEVQPNLEVLGEAVQGEGELEEAVAQAIQGTAEGFEAAAAALESVETALQEAGVLEEEDTETFEPSQEADA